MTILNTFFSKKHDLIIVNQPSPHKLCRICDSDGDLSKPWYVKYYAWDQTNELLKHKRVVLNQGWRY